MRTFAELLVSYTRRTGVSDAELARTLGVQRQTVFRWKEGLVERPRRREDVTRLAEKLRLSPAERDELLLAAGFAPESPLAAPVPAVPLVATSPSEPTPRDEPSPKAEQPADSTAASPVYSPTRRRRVTWAGLALALSLAALGIAFRTYPGSGGHDYPQSLPGETLVIVGTFDSPGGTASSSADSRSSTAERLASAIAREARAGRVSRLRVVTWPDRLADAGAATAALGRSGASVAVGGSLADDQLSLTLVAQVDGRVDDLPLEALVRPARTIDLTTRPDSTDDVRAFALLVVGRTSSQRGNLTAARSELARARSLDVTSQSLRAALGAELGYVVLAARPPDPTSAVEALDQAIGLAESPSARLNRGIAHLRLADATGWREDLARAAVLAPTDPAPRLALCWAHALEREPGQALPHCEAARAMGSRVNEPLAIILAEQGKAADAAAELRAYLKWLDTQPAALRDRATERAAWLQTLEAGENPFDDALLERLRRE